MVMGAELDTAAAAWRAKRHAILADVVDALAAREEPIAIAGRDKASFQRTGRRFVSVAASAMVAAASSDRVAASASHAR